MKRTLYSCVTPAYTHAQPWLETRKQAYQKKNVRGSGSILRLVPPACQGVRLEEGDKPGTGRSGPGRYTSVLGYRTVKKPLDCQASHAVAEPDARTHTCTA